MRTKSFLRTVSLFSLVLLGIFLCFCSADALPGQPRSAEIGSHGNTSHAPDSASVVYPIIDQVKWLDDLTGSFIYDDSFFFGIANFANNTVVKDIPVRFLVDIRRIGKNGNADGFRKKLNYVVDTHVNTILITVGNLPVGVYSIKVKQALGVFQASRVLVVYPASIRPPVVHHAVAPVPHIKTDPHDKHQFQGMYVPIVDLHPATDMATPIQPTPMPRFVTSSQAQGGISVVPIAPNQHFTVVVTIIPYPEQGDDGVYNVTLADKNGKAISGFNLCPMAFTIPPNTSGDFSYSTTLDGYATKTGAMGGTELPGLVPGNPILFTVTLSRPCVGAPTYPCQSKSFQLSVTK